jgi:hypothetical protein
MIRAREGTTFPEGYDVADGTLRGGPAEMFADRK